MKKVLAVALLGLAIAGCDPTPQDFATANMKNSAAASRPEVMGVLPDGRQIRSVRIDNPHSSHWHFVYYIDNATVTANNTFSSGKSTANEAIVTLPANTSPDDIIKYAENLKAQQRAKDEAELARIQKRLGIDSQ